MTYAACASRRASHHAARSSIILTKMWSTRNDMDMHQHRPSLYGHLHRTYTTLLVHQPLQPQGVIAHFCWFAQTRASRYRRSEMARACGRFNPTYGMRSAGCALCVQRAAIGLILHKIEAQVGLIGASSHVQTLGQAETCARRQQLQTTSITKANAAPNAQPSSSEPSARAAPCMAVTRCSAAAVTVSGGSSVSS